MKKLIALSLIACMAVSAAACGSSSSSESSAAETTETTETTETADAAEETADAADTTASDKTWIVAMDTVFRPFEYTDESGNFVGIDVDILKAVAEDQGFKYEIQSLGWDAAVAAVQAGPVSYTHLDVYKRQAIDRAGLVGSDGETHQGIFDLSYLSSIPNMHIMAPKNKWELSDMLKFAVEFDGPIALRYPRGEAYDGLREFRHPIVYGKSEILYEEEDIALLAVGSMVKTAEVVRHQMCIRARPWTMTSIGEEN